MTRLLGIIFLLWGYFGAHAAQTQATLLLSETSAKSDSTITAAVRLKMNPKWHTYWRNPGDSGKATKIEWTLPTGFTAGEIQWPVPIKGKLDELYSYEYHDEAALLVPITISSNAPNGPQTLKAKVSWVECEVECVIGKADLSASVTVGPNSVLSPDATRIDEWKKRIPKAGSEVEISARWDGPGSSEERSVLFSIKQPGAWDFFNYRLENADVMAKTERLPDADGQVRFRKLVKKWEGDWPKELPGLLLIPGDQATAREIVVKIEEGGAASSGAIGAMSASATVGAVEKKPLLTILGFAFLGGLILNIMPCVLPVLALKILGFVRQSNEDPKRLRTLGLIYGLGVVVSFLVLAGFIIAIKQSTGSATWGMQFQNPRFLIFITSLVMLIALNLFGVFEINLGGRAMDAAGGLASREGTSGAFFNGALATLLATPCTAPFLAPALGFAFTQSTMIIVLTFVTIAIGMAFPYVLLCFFPAWLRRLPKPGPWMEKFKNAMGFPMLATAIWLFSVSLSHFGKNGALAFGLFLATLAFAAWIFGEFVQRGTKRRSLGGVFAAGTALFALFYFLPALKADTGAIQWQKWSPAAVQAARAQGRPVLVDFTADWCLTCQVNKKTSIEILSTREKLREVNAVALLADNTLDSPEIAEELKRYQRAGVPLVLVFPASPEAPAIVLPEVLTPNIVLEALDKAAKDTRLSAK